MREKFASRICAVAGPSAVFCLLALLFSIFPVFYPRRVFVPVSGLVIVGLMYILRRLGRPVAAVNLLVLFLSIVFLSSVFINGGVMAPAYVGLMLCLIIVAWFYGVGAVVVYVGMVVGVGGLTLFLDHCELLPEAKFPSPFFYWIIFSIYYVGAALLLVFSYGMLGEALRSLGERENLLSSIYASIDDSLFLVDANGGVVEMNDSAKGVSKMLFEECGGKSVMDLELELEGKGECRLSEMLERGGDAVSGRRMRVRCGGVRRWFSLSSAPLASDGGSERTVLLMRDITEEVSREYHLEHSRKMEALGRLAGGVAHDFNNMLAAIIGSVEVLRGDASESQGEMLDIVHKAAKKAAKLTGELLVFSHKSPVGMGTVDIHGIIRDTVLILGRTVDKKVDVKMELDAGEALVQGDDALIQSSLMNIGINACHAMPGGGKLVFRTSNVEIGDDGGGGDYVGFDISSGKYLRVEIEDTGAGIPEEIVGRIFEPFFTTKKIGEGTGLGLYVAYGMAEKHSGAIKVRSEVGEGTTFELLLPVAAGAVAREGRGDRESSGDGVLLVVDDEELIRRMESRMLEGLGYTVLTASGGEEALRILEKEKIDLVLLDIVMPGMNGVEVFEEMLSRGHETPVIVVSGHTRDENLSEMFEKGLAGFLSKPCARGKLAEKIAEALSRRKRAPSRETSADA